jgi:hypothetical protein
MPKTKKGGRRQQRQQNGTSTAYALQRSIMPLELRRRFNYCEKITMNPATGGLAASHFFSCNSLYDPNRTGTGHQPLGFDELVGVFYDHFTVTRAKLRIVAMSSSGTVSTANCVFAVHVRDTTTGAATDITTAIEQGDSDWGVLGNPNGNAATLCLEKVVMPVKWLGRSGALADSQLKGSSASSPAEECFFEISAASIAADDPDAVDILVTVEYDAILTERMPLAQS